MFRNLVKFVTLILALMAAGSVQAQSKISTELVWSISGTPVGTDRELNQNVTLTERNLFVGGSIQTGDRRRQVIQVFANDSGRYVGTIEDVTGENFAGHGERIAANERFMVTSTYRPPVEGGGALQVFDAQTGAHLRTIPNPRASDSLRFGQLQFSLNGSKILAGVGQSDDNLSTSWVFDAETGAVLLTIDEPDNESGILKKASRTLFGFANALTETHILISANQQKSEGIPGVGAAYLFDAETGELLQTFRPEGPESGMMFGSQVAMNDTLVFISALRASGPLDWPGTEINAYDLKTGALLYTLTDPFLPRTSEEVLAGNHGSNFGQNFSLWGNTLVVGTPKVDGVNEQSGGLIFYDAKTGETVQGILNDRGRPKENFGFSAAFLDGLMTVVSTPEVAPFRDITRIDAYRISQE